MAASASAITPPPGFELEQPHSTGAIQPPPGFELERSAASPIAPPKLTVGGPDSRSIQMEPNGPIAGLPGAAPNTQPATPAMTKIAGAGIGAAALGVDGPPVVAGIARFAAKHPLIAQTIGSTAISQARRLPYVGKLIPPYSEMLPFLFSGKGKGGEAEPAPENTPIEDAPLEGEYVDAKPGEPSGPPIARSELVRPRGLPQSASVSRDLPYRRGPGEIAPEEIGAPDESRLAVPVRQRPGIPALSGRVEPSTPYRKVGGIEPEDVGPPDANVLAHRGGIRIARPDNRGLALPPKPLNYPPAEPSGPYDGPIPAAPRGIHDTLDDQAVREEVNDAIGRSDRKWQAEDRADRDARNSPAMSKGMLTGQVDEHGIPLQPVKLTKTPGARAIATPKSRATIAKPGPGSDDDLTPILEKSLKEARIARAKK